MSRISIIVPVYNVEEYIDKCIKSLLAIDYKDFEVILVDDGSTDNSGGICDSYKEVSDRISVFHQENSGVSVARNKGLANATGEWIAFVDPDDYVSPNLLTMLSSKINSDVDVISCSCYGIDDERQIKSSFFPYSREFSGEEKLELYKQLMDSQYGQPQKAFTAIGVPWGKLYRKEVIDNNCLFFQPKLRRMQDNIFNQWFFYYSRKVVYIDLPLYYYRLDNIKTYSKRNSANLERIYSEVIKARTDFFLKTGLDKELVLKKFFYRESVLFLFGVLNESVLLSEKTVGEKKKNIDRLVSDSCFSNAVEGLVPRDFRKVKHRAELDLLKKKNYSMFIFLGSTVQKMKRMVK